jgi:hypothetical protein
MCVFVMIMKPVLFVYLLTTNVCLRAVTGNSTDREHGYDARGRSFCSLLRQQGNIFLAHLYIKTLMSQNVDVARSYISALLIFYVRRCFCRNRATLV